MTEVGPSNHVLKDKEVAPRVVVENLWKENLRNFNLYHGTSEVIADNILKNGLRGESKPYDSEDQRFIEEQAFLWGIRDEGLKYSMGKDSVFFITCSEDTASKYALSGPEMMRIHLLPLSKELRYKMIRGGAEKNYLEDYEKVNEIKDKWLKQVMEHRPALIKIKKDSESYKKIINNRLNERERILLENQEAFYKYVEEFSNESGINIEVAAKSVIDEIKGKFFNEAVKGDLNPEDLEIISGKEFDSLNQDNLIYALIRKVCFEGKNIEQPFELLNFIYNYVYYKSGTVNDLEGLLSYYEMSNKGIEILESMVILSRQLKSSGLLIE